MSIKNVPICIRRRGAPTRVTCIEVADYNDLVIQAQKDVDVRDVEARVRMAVRRRCRKISSVVVATVIGVGLTDSWRRMATPPLPSVPRFV